MPRACPEDLYLSMLFPIIAVMWKVFAHGLVIGGLLVSGIAFGQKAHPGAVAEFTLNPFEAPSRVSPK